MIEEEHCAECGEPTGRAGIGEDSLYTEEGDGPFCEECWGNIIEENSQFGVGA